MRDAFIRGLCQLAERDPRIMLVTGDLGFRVLDEFIMRFPQQFLNAGVAEQNMTGVACGLALEGRIVFTYSIGNFVALRCLEQLRNGAAYHRLNVNPVSVGAGFTYGQLGASHHATEDISIMRSIPDCDVICPGDDWEAEQIPSLIAGRGHPSYVRLETQSGALHAAQPRNTDREDFTFGRGRVLREGQAVTLVTTGGLSRVVCQAADQLKLYEIDARVLHLHSIVPLDKEVLLDAASQTSGIVTIEEHVVNGGLGGAVAEVLLESGMYPQVFRRLGIRTGFSRIVGSQNYLRQAHGIDADGIAAAVKNLIDENSERYNLRRLRGVR